MIDERTLITLRATPAILTSLVRGLPDHAMSTPFDEGWSVRHVVAHILDVDEVIFNDRIQRILGEDRPFIRSIDPLARMGERGLLDREAADMIGELARRRPDEVTAIQLLSDTQLARAGEHDEAGEITVSDLVYQWTYHDLMHLKQAASILQAPLVTGMGNTRKFYDL